MRAFRARQHAFGGSGFAGNDQIITAEIQLFQRQGHERKIFLVQPSAGGQTLDECRRNVPGLQQWGKALPVQHVRENVGLRVEAAQRFEHPLAPPHIDQPIMHQRHFRRGAAHQSHPLSRSAMAAVIRASAANLPSTRARASILHRLSLSRISEHSSSSLSPGTT